MKASLQNSFSAWWLAGILLLAVILRVGPFPDLTRGSMEFGEGWIMAKASQPLSMIISEIVPEEAPMKYYALHPLLYWGRSELLIRLPALLFDLASMLMVFLLGRLLFDKKTGLWACFFMAVSMWNIHHATLARNYPLYAFSSLLSVYILYYAAQSRRPQYWFYWGLSLIFAFYSFYASLFIIAAQALWFLGYSAFRKGQIKNFTFSLGLFAVAALPGLLRFGKALERKTDFGTGLWGLQGSQIGEALRDHFGGTTGFFPWGIVVFMLSFLWLVRFKAKRSQAMLLLALVAFPLCCYIGCIYFFRISVLPRHFFHLYPFFILLAAAGIVSWPHWSTKLLGGLIFVLPISLYGLFQAGLVRRENIPYDYLRHYPDFSLMASVIQKNKDRLDYVAVDPWQSVFAIQYYLDKHNKEPIKVKNSEEKCPIAVYESPDCIVFGTMGDGSFLKELAFSGRLLVIDTLGFMGDGRYQDNGEMFSWLRTHSDRIERFELKYPQPVYAPEHSADFYFMRSFKDLRRSPGLSQKEFTRSGEWPRRVIYPFNSQEPSV